MPEPMEFGCSKCSELKKKIEDRLELIRESENSISGTGLNDFRMGQISVMEFVLRELRD